MALARRRALSSDPARFAGYLDSLAQVFFAAGSADALAAADSLFRRALDVRVARLPREELAIAASLSNLATVRDYQGRWTDALEMERRALSIRLARQGERNAGVAACRRQVGAFLFYLGRYTESEEELGRALATFSSLDRPDTARLVDVRNAMGEAQRSQDRHDEAERSFRSAIELLRAPGGGDPAMLAVLENNLAGLYKDQARYTEAEPLLLESLAIRERSKPPSPEALATGHLNLGEVYRLQGRLEEAEPHYREGLTLARRLFGSNNPNLTLFINQAAALHHALGHTAEADSLYRESLALAEGTLGPQHPLVAQVLQDLGEHRLAHGRRIEARDALDRALAIRLDRLGPESPEAAVTRVTIARSLEAEPSPDEPAIAGLVTSALAVLEKSGAFLESRVDGYALRAGQAERRGDAGAAVADLAQAAAMLDTLRRVRGGGDDVRAAFFAGRQAIFDRLVAHLIERDEIPRAFAVHERSRARQLLDEIEGARVNLRAGVPADALVSLDAQERTARFELAVVQRRLESLQNDPNLTAGERLERVENLTAARDSAAWRLQRVRQAAKERSPIWQDVLNRSGGSVELAELQRSLVTGNRVALVYRIGESASHLFVIPPAPLTAFAIPLTLDAAAGVALGGAPGPLTASTLLAVFDSGPVVRTRTTQIGLSALLASAEPAGDDTEAGAARWRSQTDDRLHHLRRTLLPDSVWKVVRGARLAIVVPDAALHLLPFDALVVRPRRGGRGPAFWLDDGPPILYASTLTSMMRLAERPPVPERETGNRVAVLSVADPSFDAPAIPEPSPLRLVRSPLPGSRIEAQAVRYAFAPESVFILQGRSATEGNVRAALRGEPYLHFATHGFVTVRRGEVLAGLALAEPDSSTPRSSDDGLLQLYEIYELPLACELAVLSACETHRGPNVPGEGVFALSRGFLIAGARRAVATLWPVRDLSTSRLVGELFIRIAKARRAGRVPDYAQTLWEAKRATRARANWSRPSSWAPFVLVGQE